MCVIILCLLSGGKIQRGRWAGRAQTEKSRQIMTYCFDMLRHVASFWRFPSPCLPLTGVLKYCCMQFVQNNHYRQELVNYWGHYGYNCSESFEWICFTVTDSWLNQNIVTGFSSGIWWIAVALSYRFSHLSLLWVIYFENLRNYEKVYGIVFHNCNSKSCKAQVEAKFSPKQSFNNLKSVSVIHGQRRDRILRFFLRPGKSGNFLHLFGRSPYEITHETWRKRRKSSGESKNAVETAPRNCRFLSLVVVEPVLLGFGHSGLERLRDFLLNLFGGFGPGRPGDSCKWPLWSSSKSHENYRTSENRSPNAATIPCKYMQLHELN